MKTFTKLFLATALVVVYLSGYGASFAWGLKGEGTFIPKTPTLGTTETSIWLGKPNFRLSSAGFKKTGEYGVLKTYSKSLALPKRSFSNYTANSAQASMVGINLLATGFTFDEGRLKPTLNAYPNPSKGKFTISLSQANGATYKITISNTIGQVIRTIVVPESAQNSGFIFDLSDKPAGVYFYSLSVNDKLVETKRLILQQ